MLNPSQIILCTQYPGSAYLLYPYVCTIISMGKSVASFCHQVAALVPAMFCNFYVAKNHKIADNSATTETREKISAYLESLEC